MQYAIDMEQIISFKNALRLEKVTVKYKGERFYGTYCIHDERFYGTSYR